MQHLIVKIYTNDSIVSLVDSVNKEKIGKDELAFLKLSQKKLKKGSNEYYLENVI
ncbi:hypothetical protein ACK2F8_19960 [Clostridioides difficile]